jgi:hypothetical protein
MIDAYPLEDLHPANHPVEFDALPVRPSPGTVGRTLGRKSLGKGAQIDYVRGDRRPLAEVRLVLERRLMTSVVDIRVLGVADEGAGGIVAIEVRALTRLVKDDDGCPGGRLPT